MAGTLTVDTIQSDSSYASTLNVASKMNFSAGMQIGGQDTTFGGMRNRIINGDMRIDQRNAGASSNNTADGIYVLDRWQTYGYPQNPSNVSVQQVSTAPTGYAYSQKITSLGNNTPTSLSYLSLCQCIEGVNIIDLAWGTASASPVTISFWVQSSLTGTFGGSLQNAARSYCYPFTYTINSANTWEYKTVTILGPTSGTWTTTNGVGIQLAFQLGIGSTYGGTAGAWTTSNKWGVSGAVNISATSGATMYITGVQLEKGSAATAFENRQYSTELALCQRYFWRVYGSLLDISMNNQTAPYSSMIFCTLTNPVTMRTSGTFAHNMTNAKNAGGVAPGADQWSWYIQNQGYGTTSSGDIANVNGGGQLYCRIGAYTLSPSAASTGVRMGSNIYIENSAEL
jgi:hypothetical protein